MATMKEKNVVDIDEVLVEEESSTESDEENMLGRINTEEGRKKKPGIIFLSSIPQGMNVSQTTSFFCQFGKVGRVFLQPDTGGDKKGGGSNGKLASNFTEGWIEFLSKTIAKQVAKELNSTPVGGKRRSKAHNQLWNIKYLPRFKWTHLSERLAYETAVRQQRMRTEISQVKREADHFKSCVEQKKRQKKSKKEKCERKSSVNLKPLEFHQKETDAVIRKRKREKDEVDESETQPAKKKKTKKSKSEKTKKRKNIVEEKFVSESPSKSQKKPDELLLARTKSKKSKKGEKDKHREDNCRKKRGDKKERLARRKSSDSNDRSKFLKSVFGGKN